MDGILDGVEFVSDDDPEGREPGTYVVVKLDENARIHPGRVRVVYVD